MSTVTEPQEAERASEDPASRDLPSRDAVSEDSAPTDPPKKSRRRSTSHLKLVPPSKELRDQMRAKCAEVAAKFDRSRPKTKDEMEVSARALLSEMGQPEGYLGWTMVVLASEFWRDQIAAIPPSRRLFLLPHCLKHAEGCPADYDEFGLDCRKCGACSIADYRGTAEDMGHKVLVAEGSPIVLKIIVSGHVDAIVGVACLNVLEKAIDKILLAGIPCMAVPLLSSDCRNTSVDDDWVWDMIKLEKKEQTEQSKSYVHLLRASANFFSGAELDQLIPPARGKSPARDGEGISLTNLDPIAATEIIARDFLARGGKYSRPFITLAVHDAVTGGHGVSAKGAEHLAALPLHVKRASMAIEAFHKASLVHDDIEDDDKFRYGEATVHRQFGVPTAINVGDYLIGLGYRLVSREAAALGGEAAAAILDVLADAHMKLSEGQGAELLWRDGANKNLSPLDALKIYALKTSPAFEAAILTGLRLAGPLDGYVEPVKLFARNLGVAFQILNDLGDWQGDSHNKLSAGGDVLGGRPTVLWALALESLSEKNRAELLSLAADSSITAERKITRVRQLYTEAGVFHKAMKLVDKHQQRAEAIADEIEPEELRRLFYYLIDSVLDRPEAPETVPLSILAPVALPITVAAS